MISFFQVLLQNEGSVHHQHFLPLESNPFTATCLPTHSIYLLLSSQWSVLCPFTLLTSPLFSASKSQFIKPPPDTLLPSSVYWSLPQVSQAHCHVPPVADITGALWWLSWHSLLFWTIESLRWQERRHSSSCPLNTQHNEFVNLECWCCFSFCLSCI